MKVGEWVDGELADEFEGGLDEIETGAEKPKDKNRSNGRAGHGRANVGLTSSPLARPKSDLHRLAANVQDLYYLPDPAPLYVALGCLAANMMAGLPLWMMLTGAAGSFKTSTVRCLSLVPRVIDVGDISGKGAFLSGVANKEKDKGATGGLLREVGDRGMLLMEDFSTSVMSLQRDTRQDIISTLRLVYNGEFSRDVGAGGAKRMSWSGKVGLLAAGTNEIDRQSSEANALGERWLYYRLPQDAGDDRGAARAAVRDMRPGVSKRLWAEMVGRFVEGMGLCWPVDERGHYDEAAEEVGRRLDGHEEARVLAMGELISKARSAPAREQRFPYEIIGPPDREFHTRISAQLRQIYLGLERIGLGADERWGIVGKIARDSMPMGKANVVWALADGRNNMGLRVGELAEGAMGGVGKGTAERACEDLGLVGVVWVDTERGSKGESGKMRSRVRLSDWARRLIRIGWGAGV